MYNCMNDKSLALIARARERPVVTPFGQRLRSKERSRLSGYDGNNRQDWGFPSLTVRPKVSQTFIRRVISRDAHAVVSVTRADSIWLLKPGD
jgi:hypothetical protein